MGGFVTWTWQAVTLTGYSGDGVLGIQPDWFGGEGGGQSASIGGVPALMPYGIAGRPKAPDTNGACHCLVGDAGAESFVIPLVDPRLYAKMPVLTEGSSCLYADWGAWVQLDDATKTINVYNPYVFANGVATKAHSVQIGLDSSGQAIMNFLHGSGTRISMVDDKITIANKSGTAFLEINNDGWFLTGNGKVLGALDIGNPSLPLAKAAGVVSALQAIATALASPVQVSPATGTGTLTGGTAAASAIAGVTATIPTAMLKGF